MLLLIAACVVLMLVRVRLPVGGYYWDLDLYPNAAHRFSLGQYPHVDYFSQVGSLSLALYAACQKLFPSAHPILAAQWSILAIAIPLLWPTVREVERRSRLHAMLLAGPFVVFAFLPYNINEYFLSTAPDAYGIYNRQAGLVLYVLTTALVWSERGRFLALTSVVAVCTLTFVKVTALFPALVFIGFSVVAGRARPGVMVAALVALVLVALGLEAKLGLTSAFLADLRTLTSINDAGLPERFVGSVARQFDVLILFAAIFVLSGAVVLAQLPGGRLSWSSTHFLLRSDAAWVAVFTCAAVLYESQNTGSNDFIYLWPMWLRVLLNGLNQGRRRSYVLGALIAAATIPSMTTVMERTARASVNTLNAVPLPAPHLVHLGAARVSVADLDRAATFLRHYPLFSEAYQDLSDRGQTQTFNLFAQPDWQIFYLLSVEEAVTAIEAFERERNISIRSAFTLDFVDPVTRLIGAIPPRHVSLALDPRRTFPPPTDLAMKEVGSVDALVVPLCPVNGDRVAIAAAYAPALAGRTAVRVSPCWELRLRPGLLEKRP